MLRSDIDGGRIAHIDAAAERHDCFSFQEMVHEQRIGMSGCRRRVEFVRRGQRRLDRLVDIR